MITTAAPVEVLGAVTMNTEDADLPRIGTAAAPVTVRGDRWATAGVLERCRPWASTVGAVRPGSSYVLGVGAGVLGGGGNGWEAGLSLKG